MIPMTTLRTAIIPKAAIVQFLEFGHTSLAQQEHCTRARINTSLAILFF